MSKAESFLRDESGQAMTEYALIVLAVMETLRAFRGTVLTVYMNTVNKCTAFMG